MNDTIEALDLRFKLDQGSIVDIVVTMENGEEITYRLTRHLHELGKSLIVFGLGIVDQDAKARNLEGAAIPMGALDVILGHNGELELKMMVSGQPLHVAFPPGSARGVHEALGQALAGETRGPSRVN